jgi:nucleotide-binding universal stress UspA family protein
MEAVVFNHILVPLDGSALAECVLPHVIAIAAVTNAHITLTHVLEHPDNENGDLPVDPMGWHIQKQESQAYLERIAGSLKNTRLDADYAILEGQPAKSIIEFAHTNAVDLIALSTHGHSGLSDWSISSVVEKVLARSFRSILLVPAYAFGPAEENKYERLFICYDGSTRAEYILPAAISLAQFHNSQLVFGTVIQRPQFIQRFPLSEVDVKLIDQITSKNEKTANRYYEQIVTQLSLKGLDVETHVAASDHTISTLHDMVANAEADLVMMVAHGDSGERRWPYGSVATSFIKHGSTPLLILQDLSENEAAPTPAEKAVREIKGH